MPQPKSISFVGFGREVTPGTAVAPTAYSPALDLKPSDMYHYVPDKGLRGSYVSEYDMIQTQAWATYEFTQNLFVDVVGWPLKGLMGDEVVTGTASGASTTLNGALSAAATNIVVASGTGIANGDTIQIDTGTSAEVRTVSSGGGTTTLVVSSGVAIAHSNGVAVNRVVAPFLHNFCVLNTAPGQPSTTTITEYNGSSTRQWANALFNEFTLKLAADQLMEINAKALALKSATTSKPTQSFSTVAPKAGYTGAFTVAGSSIGFIQSAEITIKRPVDPLVAITGTLNPYKIWSGAIECSFKLTAIFEDDTTLMADYTGATPVTFDVTATSGSGLTTQAFQVHSTKALFTKADYNRGKEYVELDCEGHLVANTTDIGQSAGYSPVKVTVSNAQSAVY